MAVPGGVHGMAQAMRAGTYTRPRNVLAFFWAVIATVISGSVLVILALNSAGQSKWVPWVLVFTGVLIVAALTVVVVAMFTDPTRLMLGEMTGQEYTTYRAMTLGDNLSGERVEPITMQGARSAISTGAVASVVDERVSTADG